jgi:TonB family protein
MNVPKDTKTTVQFTVDRFGSVTNITLRRSSGNNMWDHLSMRAVQISKVPELPPNYRAPALSLNFNFTPN